MSTLLGGLDRIGFRDTILLIGVLVEAGSSRLMGDGCSDVA